LQLNIKPLSHPGLEALNLRKKINSNDFSNVKTYVSKRFKLDKHYKIEEKMEKLILNLTTWKTTSIPKELLIKQMSQIDKELTLISLQNNQSSLALQSTRLWAQQRQSQLTINKLKRVYSKLSYITGKRLDKTPLTVEFQVNGQTEILQDPDKIAHAIKSYNINTFPKLKAGSLIKTQHMTLMTQT
jgi:hypothetical protein